MAITSLTDNYLARRRSWMPLVSKCCSSLGRRALQKLSTDTNISSRLSMRLLLAISLDCGELKFIAGEVPYPALTLNHELLRVDPLQTIYSEQDICSSWKPIRSACSSLGDFMPGHSVCLGLCLAQKSGCGDHWCSIFHRTMVPLVCLALKGCGRLYRRIRYPGRQQHGAGGCQAVLAQISCFHADPGNIQADKGLARGRLQNGSCACPARILDDA